MINRFCFHFTGDNSSASNKSAANENANSTTDDSNVSSSGANATTAPSENAVKFVEAPLPKVNAWKVSPFKTFNHLFMS